MPEGIALGESTDRPATAYAGQFRYESDTTPDQFVYYDGSAWLPIVQAAWSTYTPTLTQSGTVTKTVTYAAYCQIGKQVTCTVRLDATGAGTGSNLITVSLPVTAAYAASILPAGIFYFYDSSATTYYVGMAGLASTTTVAGQRDGVAGRMGGTSPTAAIASGDQIGFSITYEAA